MLNPFSKTCDKIASARLVRIAELSSEKPEVHLALISLPPFDHLSVRLREHTIVQQGSKDEVDKDASRRLLVDHSQRALKNLLEMYENSLRVSLEELKADIVCMNELSFPTRNQEPLKKAVTLTRQLAKAHNCLIVAGSAHDRRTLYNTSYLFYPGCPPSGEPYHKQVSATSVGELVSVPAKRRTICTRVFGLNIAVLICLDIADFSAVASVVKFQDRVDLLLVPCYSEYMDSLDRVAKATSAALCGVVALVNYRPPAPRAPCIVEEFGETRAVDRDRVLDSGGIIHSVFIKPPELLARKLKIKGNPDERMEWLFGPQNVEPR
jgi:hypothetical protein